MGDRVRPALARLRVPGWLRTTSSAAIAIIVLGGIVLGTGPAAFAHAMAGFRLVYVPAILLAAAAAMVVQGLRWHLLLRSLGVKASARDTVLLSVAGQAVTAILPLGDLTRAIFVAESYDTDFGPVAATVTVQELSFTLLLVTAACPAMIRLHQSPLLVALTILAILGILALLLVPPLFHAVHSVVARTPLLRRLLTQIDELQQETVTLLHRPETVGWSLLDLVRVFLSVSVFWLVVQGLAPGSITWWEAAFVLAVSYVGGAVSLIPGGAGATEATTVGALLLLGLGPGTATAAALLQRLMVSGVSTLLGFAAYAVARRRFPISGFGLLHAGEALRSARARG